jgi:hypothetical protein
LITSRSLGAANDAAGHLPRQLHDGLMAFLCAPDWFIADWVKTHTGGDAIGE